MEKRPEGAAATNGRLKPGDAAREAQRRRAGEGAAGRAIGGKGSPGAAPAAPARVLNPLEEEVYRVKQELDHSNGILKRLLRELDERGPNGPGVPKLWESVRQAATTSDQLIQRLERLRSELTQQSAG